MVVLLLWIEHRRLHCCVRIELLCQLRHLNRVIVIKPILTEVGIENRGIHLQSWFSGIVVTLEPVRLFISVAVDFIVKLVAYYFALFFVYFVFEIVENREKHLSCEHAV